MSAAKKKLIVSELKAHYFTEKYTVKAVDGINFELLQGESMAIVGESGCGKSTLGAALLRVLQNPGKIVGGSVILDGMDILKASDSEFNSLIRWKKIAMIFQGAMNTLDPVYTVGSQLAEILKVHHFEGNEREKISSSLAQVGLDKSVAGRYPHELSGGMKQRVVIAMALLLEPELLIADEPTTALDVLVQAQIMNVLKALKRDKGVTVILITHDLSLVSSIADKIGIMYAGQMVEFGSSRDIYTTPKHPYTQALIAAIPRLHSEDRQVRFVRGIPPNLHDPPAGCRFYARCPHAMDICLQDPPEFVTGNIYARCWLYKNESESIRPPSTKP